MKSFDKTYALEPSFIVIALLFLSNKFLLIKALDSSPMLNALSRNPENLFSDIFNFFKLFYILIKFRPNLILSVTPKVGAIVSLISFILKIKSVHYFTGQVWKNKSGLMKFFLKRIDIMTSFFSYKISLDKM